MQPHGVAGLDALARAQRAPQRRGVTEPTRAQLEPDQRGEGLLGGTAGGAAAAYGLLHLGRGRHPLVRCLADDLVDPALDQGERGLEAGQRGLLRRCLGRLEQATLERLLDRGGVGRVDAPDLLLHAGGVDGHATAVVGHGRQEVLTQPRHVREEALVRGLTEGEVEHHVVLAHVEARGERGHVGGQQGGLAGRAERQPDVGGGEHLGGQAADRRADLGAEHRATHLAEHAQQRAGHRLRLLGKGLAHRPDDALGDRLDQASPDLPGGLDPLGPAPGRGRGDAGAERGGLVEPVVGQAHAVGDLVLLGPRGGGVGVLGHRAAGDVAGQRPVHRAVVGRHHRLDLAHQTGQVGHLAAEELLEGSALEGVVGLLTGVVAHGTKLLALW